MARCVARCTTDASRVHCRPQHRGRSGIRGRPGGALTLQQKPGGGVGYFASRTLDPTSHPQAPPSG